MASLRTISLLVATGTILSATTLAAQDVVPAARIVDKINESQLVTLSGNTHPAARAQNDRGRVSAETPMTDLILVLSRGAEQQAAFDRFVASQYDSNSPNFHKWLEPEEVGERFGPAQSDIDTASGWLRSHGFSVDEITKNRMSIRFSGTAAQVESAFHTEIHNLEVKGRHHIGNMTDPRIPAALVPSVAGVKALHNFFPHPLHRVGSPVIMNSETGKWERVGGGQDPLSLTPATSSPSRPRPEYGITTSSGLIEDVAPYDFATIYNVIPLWSAGVDGTGQTVAIAGTSNINPNDVVAFRSAFKLPANPVTVIVANGTDPGQCGVTSTSSCTLDDQIENTLDVEWSGAVAKGASIVLVTAGANSQTTDTLWASENYIVQNKTAPVMNVSYGECELGMGSAGNADYYNMWQTAATEGIAVFVATGDSGSPACDQGGSSQYGNPYEAEYGLSVSGMASTPYNTAVGGTDFNWGTTASPYWNSTNSVSQGGASAKGYIPEVPWNDSCANPEVLSLAQQMATLLNQSRISVTAPTDGETACNIIANYYSDFTPDFSWLVDTVGGGGGKSNCVMNDGNDVTSCTGTATVSGVPLVNDGYKKPVWQAGVTGTTTDQVRDIPDVSFFAANGFSGSAYLICVSASGTCSYSSTSEPPGQEEVGGTSVSSPAMAGVMALINQKAGTPQGSPNAGLYYLAAKQTYSACSSESVKSSSTTCYFNDVDKYTNAMPCDYGFGGYISPNCKPTHSGDTIGVVGGYTAVAGYDLATGLGSLNVANVVNNWPGPIVPVASLTPASVTFASTVQGTAATAQSITLKNTGKASLTSIAVSITGDASFTQTNTCTGSLAAAASCTITVKFTPASIGQLSATISVADNASGSPQTVSISGTGAVAAPAVSLSAATLTFASTAVGTAAATQKITVTNSGTAALTWNSPAVSLSGNSSFSQTNTCTSALAIKATCTITVTFKPSSVGALSGSVSLADNAAGSPQAVSLSGTGSGAVAGLSVNSLAFSPLAVGSTATKTVTLTNSGNAALTLASTAFTIAGTNATSFSQSNKCGTSVAANASCVITVNYKPAAGGQLSATLNVAGTTGGLPLQVALSGSGLAPAVSLSSASLTFSGTPVGTPAATQQVTLTNTGTAPLTLAASAVTLSGTGATSYSQSNTCGTSVAVSGSCAITVTFTPKASGTLTSAVSIADNATGSPEKITLSGSGTVPAASLSAASLTFSSTTVGTSAATKSITLSNTGGAPLTITGITITGTNASSFSQTNTCAQGVAAGANCTITVTFSPMAGGALSASVNLADNVTGSPQKVSLTGTGAAPTVTLSPTSLTFSGTAVASSAATKTVTLKNTGSGTLLLNGAGQGIGITGTNASSFSQTNTCGASVAASASCTITVTFTPQAKGAATAAVAVTDNATASPQKATLSGTGQ
jgi:hypothetical protein